MGPYQGQGGVHLLEFSGLCFKMIQQHVLSSPSYTVCVVLLDHSAHMEI